MFSASQCNTSIDLSANHVDDEVIATEHAESPEKFAGGSHDVFAGPQVASKFREHLKLFAYSTDATNKSTVCSSQATRTWSTTIGVQRARPESAMKTKSPAPTRCSSRKRTIGSDQDVTAATKVSVKKKRTTTKQRSAADPHNPDNKLVDSIRPGLGLVFIGLNPGLMTAATGHAYSHPSNWFWKLLESSGITPKRHHPSETHDLMDLYSIGNTNICDRPTRSGDGLSKEELIEGAGTLEEKIAKHKPEAVCIVGKGIWDVIYKTKTGKSLKTPNFEYGWQDEELWLGRTVKDDGTLEWAGAKTFVTTTTSGLAAGMRPQEKLAIWKPLGDWVKEHRGLVTRLEGVKTEDNVKAEDNAGSGEHNEIKENVNVKED